MPSSTRDGTRYRSAAEELEEEEDGLSDFTLLSGVLPSRTPRAGSTTPSSLASAPTMFGGLRSFSASPSFHGTSGGSLASSRRLSAPTAAGAGRAAVVRGGVWERG